jgi:hypothetical protein
MRNETSLDGNAGTGTAPVDRRLDLNLLRLAVHGWWLGNPLVYKPETADLVAVARELAGAGARSGTVVLGEGDCADDTTAIEDPDERDLVQVVLIVRPPLPRAQAGMATALTVAEVAQEAAGRACTIEHSWEVVLECGEVRSRFCQVEVEDDEAATMIGLRLAFGYLWTHDQGGDEPATTIAARPDRREVFLARVLHRLDGRLRVPRAA